MSGPYVDATGTLHYEMWVRRSPMLVNRTALDADDPDYLYNYVKSAGIIPEDFGIEHPVTEEFKDKPRSALISEIISLRKEVEAWAKWCR